MHTTVNYPQTQKLLTPILVTDLLFPITVEIIMHLHSSPNEHLVTPWSRFKKKTGNMIAVLDGAQSCVNYYKMVYNENQRLTKMSYK